MVVVADNVPVIVTLPGIVTAPLESIVRRATPPVTIDISSLTGLIKPVLVSPLNFKEQLFRSPVFENNEFEPSCLNKGKPPLVIASCITTVFN